MALLVAEKYPLPQNLYPQSRFLNTGNFRCISKDDRHLTFCMKLLIESFGGSEMKMWTWSLDTIPK
jgi:hypothetical protein